MNKTYLPALSVFLVSVVEEWHWLWVVVEVRLQPCRVGLVLREGRHFALGATLQVILDELLALITHTAEPGQDKKNHYLGELQWTSLTIFEST